MVRVYLSRCIQNLLPRRIRRPLAIWNGLPPCVRECLVLSFRNCHRRHLTSVLSQHARKPLLDQMVRLQTSAFQRLRQLIVRLDPILPGLRQSA